MKCDNYYDKDMIFLTYRKKNLLEETVVLLSDSQDLKFYFLCVIFRTWRMNEMKLNLSVKIRNVFKHGNQVEVQILNFL